MKIALRGISAMASCVLAAGLISAGAGVSMASPSRNQNPSRHQKECHDGRLCAYSEEGYFGRMSMLDRDETDPDVTDEPEREVFAHHIESVKNNTDCTVYLYQKVYFHGEMARLGRYEQIRDIESISPKLKHHVHSVKFECEYALPNLR
jgi:hypothetical protein